MSSSEIKNAGQFFSDRTPSEEPLQVPGSSKGKAPVLPQDDLDAETVWSDCNLLTFDGGGMRGYWSLLVMRQLIDLISGCEMRHTDERAAHSFHPLEYPHEVSQEPFNESERRYRRIYDGRNGVEALDPARRYLPCHYFDYIGGTSTGALIAIMLGRLRMTVYDCLSEYERLGQQVFGRSDSFATARMLLTKGTRYRTKDAVGAYQSVICRHREQAGDQTFDRRHPAFPSIRGMCNTFVTALASSKGHQLQGNPFVIRSYEFRENVETPQGQQQTPLSEPTSRKRRMYSKDPLDFQNANGVHHPVPRAEPKIEEAHPLAIWEAARAATAAMKYFEPQRVDAAKGELFLEDAGMRMNNPTRIGMDEITAKQGNDAIGVILSVGTAKNIAVGQNESGKEYVMRSAQRALDNVTDPEPVHDEMLRQSRTLDFRYFRLNPDRDDQEHRLRILMDEWEPKGAKNGMPPGSKTLTEMKRSFDHWYESSADVRTRFRKCAEELVERRRVRTKDKSKWERYILGSCFRCPIPRCKKNRQFTFKADYEEHFQKHHSAHPQDRHNTKLDEARRSEWRYQKRDSK